MDIDDTIQAFKCCVHIPPLCLKCPKRGPNPPKGQPFVGEICRQEVKESTGFWLRYAKEAFEYGRKGREIGSG